MPQVMPLKLAISYVAGAYIGIWLIFFVYLVVVGNKLSGLHRQVEALTKAVESKKTETERVTVK